MTSILRKSLFILLIFNHILLFGQDCQPTFKLNPVMSNNNIEWSKFPDFSLPFKIIYNGPRFGDTQSQPLKHGFSHLASYSGGEPGSISVKNRAVLWYGVATNAGGNQPWANNTLRSPWGNDTTAYRNYWDNYARTIDADLICMDIERFQREDRDILTLKSNNSIPENYRKLSDADFLTTYKRDIRWWHAESINRVRSIVGNGPQITTYSDVPIRNTWLNITSNSWQNWTTDLARTHYLTQDNSGKVGGPYYDGMNILSPSPYYYYGFDNPFGKDYLSYLLFHIEVNRAWSNKPIIPFVWLRIHDSYDPKTPFITSFMAQATAIFPFFSGASGLWLWDSPFLPGDRQENYSTYEHFIYGLYRLSEFKDMFEGNNELVIPMSARDNMTAQNTIWRGVVKGNNILIAAHNPYAGDNEETVVNLYYKKWARSVTLKGKEVYLCKFDLNDTVSSTESYVSEVNVFPNPATDHLNVKIVGMNGVSDVDLSIVNTLGKVMMQKSIKAFQGENTIYEPLPTLSAGIYIVRFKSKNREFSRKILVNQ